MQVAWAVLKRVELNTALVPKESQQKPDGHKKQRNNYIGYTVELMHSMGHCDVPYLSIS